MLRFCANLSLLFNEVAMIDRFKLAKDNGFDAVEIQFPYAIPADSIAEQLQKHQLKLVLFNVDAGDLLSGGEGLAAVPEKQSQFYEAVAAALNYATILNPEVINILPGRCLNPDHQAIYQQTFLNNLQYALDAFSALAIKTVVEAINHHDMPGFMIHSSRQMLDLIEHFQHPLLGMQYDIYHMLKMDEQPANFITQYANKIGHIQFADYPGRGQPGTGQVNFKQLFKAIDQSTYDGWVGAEYIPTVETSNSLEWLSSVIFFETND